MKRSEDISPDLRSVIYETAARLGDAKTFEKLLKMHNETTSSEERVTIGIALTAFKQPELIRRALSLITTETVRLQDVGYWVDHSFMNPYAKQLTWEWMTTNWEWLDKNLGKDLSFSRMPLYAAHVFSDEKFLPTYKAFFGSVINTVLERSIKQGIETIEWQAAWKKRDVQLVKIFFNKIEK
jgi:aminopeptidase N